MMSDVKTKQVEPYEGVQISDKFAMCPAEEPRFTVASGAELSIQ